MSSQLNIFIEYVEPTFTRIIDALQGVTDEELLWKQDSEMNSINNILRHKARISLLLLPQVLQDTTTGVWNVEYEKNDHTKEELLKDLEERRRNVLSLLSGMTDVDFDLKIPL